MRSIPRSSMFSNVQPRHPAIALPSRRAPIVAAIAALLVLRIWFAFTLRVNSDEPQHLHVIWNWLQGSLPYRDFFDNHAPLFQIVHAPFLAVLGERADIVPLMRLTTLPWYALAVWLTWRLGRALFDARTGVVAAAIAALYPTFFVATTEFRPDTAWAAAWTAAVVAAVAGAATRRRAFECGLLAGLAAALSIKSALLFASAGVATALLLTAWAGQRRQVDWRESFVLVLGVAAGSAVLPILIAAAFVAAGAGEAMRYCLIVHNAASGLGRWSHPDWRAWLFPAVLPLLAGVTWLWLDRARDLPRALKGAWVLNVAVLYLALRTSYKPLLSRQDLLPAIPLLAPVVAFALLHARRRLRTLAFAGILAIEVGAMLLHDTPWHNGANAYGEELTDLLRLSTPSDYVMDDKGEAIFRRRPSYWMLENVTRYRLERGRIDDDITQQLIDHRVGVGVFDNLEGADRGFVQRNYVAVAPHVRVAGQMLGDARAGEAIGFDVVLANRYAIVGEDGPVEGLLDGSRYVAARPLAAGHHEFVPASAGRLAMLAARAASLGYSPFGKSEEDGSKRDAGEQAAVGLP